jgi:adenine-specific DNA-methyltransferase
MPESSFWNDIRGQSGADEVDQILGKRLFDFPKLTDFVIRLLDVACGPDSIVLDCTAGSGTTGHAVLALNKRDGGNRRFVLVQQPFDSKEHERAGLNICEKVVAVRVTKAAKGYSYKKPKRGGGEQRVKVDGLGGSFTYARVGDPLFGEYRDPGKKLPQWEELARYVFYTETSREFDPRKASEKSGLIGTTDAAGGTSYYLLYTPNHREDREMSLETLATIARKDKNRQWVIYCEKVWLHRDQLRVFEQEHNVRVRAMLVPFNLK